MTLGVFVSAHKATWKGLHLKIQQISFNLNLDQNQKANTLLLYELIGQILMANYDSK